MSIERTVTFGPMPERTNPKARLEVPFSIEPPITVHNPQFLGAAIKHYNNGEDFFGAYPHVFDATINFSNEVGTYGTVTTANNVPKQEYEQILSRAFTSALMVGESIVAIVFKNEAGESKEVAR